MAVCAECGRAVRCERYMFCDWEHADDLVRDEPPAGQAEAAADPTGS